MAGSNSTHAVKRDTILLNVAKGYIGGRLLRRLEDGEYRVLCLARAAREAGVRRIIYLGGLGNGRQLSGHLQSRREVGEILQHSGVPTIEFHASTIIGSGSPSFEMIRSLVEKQPVMLTPKWVRPYCQPTAAVNSLKARGTRQRRIPLPKRQRRCWRQRPADGKSQLRIFMFSGVDISLVSFQMGF